MTRRAPRVYTPQQRIATDLAKGAINRKQATNLLRELEKIEVEAETKAARGWFRRFIDFVTP